ncbi:MAG TPA: CocE/NonD family hydrolase [Vicinamibacterales bacterium]|nr:CocE/NonD family hydrolase [Vicinamibacterales bacterium]
MLLHATAALLILTQSPAIPYRTLDDRFPPPRVMTGAEWARRAAYLREHVLACAGLLPLPRKTALRPVVFDERPHADYTVAKVYFESLPGFYVTGNLYRPAGKGPFPAVLSPHGHWPYGRVENSALVSGPGRAINLARQGFVVFSYDMVGYNDSRQVPHTFGGRREALWGLSLSGLQLWNGIRALDFLESLPYVRADAIGATGESGGGTQTFLLAAADDRVAVAVPVNMISLHMQGGCLCENPPGLRLDTTNVEIAATIAPRPLLMVAATGDWTNETLEAEYPAVRALYALAGAEDRVGAVRFTADHNYNQESREAMYAWMGRWLKGTPAGAARPEQAFTPPPLPDLLVFHGRALPEGSASADTLTASWIEAARRQLAATPLATRRAALRHALAFGDPAPLEADRSPLGHRPVVLLAGEVTGVDATLASAGYTVRAIPLTPFDEAAAAKVRHFDTYNRTAASRRVADIVEALRAQPGAVLVAAGREALAGALAAAIEPPRLAILDVRGFDTGRDEDFLEHLDIPGLRRAGDLQTASEMAAGRLVIHGAGPRFDAAAARVLRSTLTPAEILGLVRAALDSTGPGD